MADTLFTMGIVCLILAVVGLICTIILYVKLKIRPLIAELTGRAARNAIARIRREGNLREHGSRSLLSIISSSEGGDATGSSSQFPEKRYNLARTEAGLVRQRSGLLTSNMPEEIKMQTSYVPNMDSELNTGLLEDISEQETGLLSPLSDPDR